MPLPISLLSSAEKAHLILFLGANDTGKTTFTTALARHFLQQGEKVAVIDADLGQSDIGPPTAIGLAILEKDFSSLAEVKPHSLYFVGSTSPVGHLLETVVGTYKLADRAKARGAERILVDTSGLISGGVGWALKQHKLELLRPDLIVALERKDELAAILTPRQKHPGVTTLRITPHQGVRRRSPEERRTLREAAFARYFQEISSLTLNWQQIPFTPTPWGWGIPLEAEERERIASLLGEEILWGERGSSSLFLATSQRTPAYNLRRLLGLWGSAHIFNLGAADLTGSYLGLYEPESETHVLGQVKSVDFPQKTITLHIPADQASKGFSCLILPKKLIQTL